MLYWISLYESLNKWESFFQADLSPAFVYCAKCMLAESKHTYITGHVTLVLTNEFTVLSILFTFDRLILFSLLLPLLCLFLFYLTDRYFPALPDYPDVVSFTFGGIPGLTVTVIWLEICDRFVCTTASGLVMT